MIWIKMKLFESCEVLFDLKEANRRLLPDYYLNNSIRLLESLKFIIECK